MLSVDGEVSGKIKFQVADVGNALGSVSRMVSTGNRLVFDPSGSYIESLDNGKRLWMRESSGVSVLDVWVAPFVEPGGQGFPGPGAAR